MRKKKQLALLVDLDRCIGCYACTIACAAEHQDSPEVERLRVVTIGGPHPNTPAGFIPMTGPGGTGFTYQLLMCQHCESTPCIPACPFDAIVKREDGIVHVVDVDCTGCGLCIPACPYDVITWKTGENVAAMCDLCYGRVDRGQSPACVESCPTDSIFFGDIYDRSSPISSHKKNVPKPNFILAGGGKDGDRPATHYVSRRVASSGVVTDIIVPTVENYP